MNMLRSSDQWKKPFVSAWMLSTKAISGRTITWSEYRRLVYSATFNRKQFAHIGPLCLEGGI